MKEVQMSIIVISLICLGLLFVTPVKADIDPDTIMGTWLFDEGRGAEVEDSSGNKYHGDIEGDVPWVEGQYGMAIELNGSEYVELQNSAADLAFGGTDPFTITAWVKNQGGGTIMGKFNGGVIGAYIFTLSSGGTVGFHREVAPWSFSGTESVPTGEFGHVAITYDGETMRIYVEGELDTEQDRGGQNTDMVTPVLIGARHTNGLPSDFFSGALDEVGLFNVALTEDQIQEVMAGLHGAEAVSPSGKLASSGES